MLIAFIAWPVSSSAVSPTTVTVSATVPTLSVTLMIGLVLAANRSPSRRLVVKPASSIDNAHEPCGGSAAK